MSARTAIIALLVVLLPACGAGSENGGSTDSDSKSDVVGHPDEPDELILRVTVGGGFIPAEFNLTELPAFSMYGDGRIITPGPQIAIYPAPALPNLQQRQITEDGIQMILAEALEAGLEGPDRTLTNDRIADAPTTVFTVVTDAGTHTTSAYALGTGTGPQEGPENDREVRDRLRQFQQMITSLEQSLSAGEIGGEQPFEPKRLRLFVREGTPEPSEPGIEQSELEWPLEGDLAQFGEPQASVDYRCGVVGGEGVQRLLDVARRANQLTPWVSEGTSYGVLFRPLLPDEKGCDWATRTPGRSRPE